jgi:hypothetical protein
LRGDGFTVFLTFGANLFINLRFRSDGSFLLAINHPGNMLFIQTTNLIRVRDIDDALMIEDPISYLIKGIDLRGLAEVRLSHVMEERRTLLEDGIVLSIRKYMNIP